MYYGLLLRGNFLDLGFGVQGLGFKGSGGLQGHGLGLMQELPNIVCHRRDHVLEAC